PICATGACCILSPLVLIITISASMPAAANSFLRTNSACHLASILPRVPIRRILTVFPGSKGIDRAALLRFESFAAALSRPANVPQVQAGASPAFHPSTFPRRRDPLPSNASWTPCATVGTPRVLPAPWPVVLQQVPQSRRSLATTGI